MVKKSRSPRRATSESSEWKAIVFGDLHVKAATLDRCVEVLARVRELAIEHNAMIVCTGDFWDLRGVLSVRQLHRIQDELEHHRSIRWAMIPGNHDQVSRDGKIHGLRVFDAYENINVVTHLTMFEAERIALVPWRENPEEQSATFATVPAGYTIFGHGEYRGATTNSRHKTDGYFGAKEVQGAAAVYLGHYHKRQLLDEKVWYVGSPYEQNMGERGMPHGVAIVSSVDPVHPQFVDFTDLPRYWRLTWPKDAKKFERPMEHDFVELRVHKDALGSPEFVLAREQLVAKDVRPVLLGETTSGDTAPAFALSLGEAADRYVDGAESDVPKEDLRDVGHTLLGEVEDKHAIVPKGSVVHLRSLTVAGFGPIRGRVKLSLTSAGIVLFRGPMGSGKTALAADAITWCLYGMTAPRKPGAAGATLRADDVINDTCSEASVSVVLRLDDRKASYRITRTKVRGKGAKIEVFRNKEPWGAAGISDAQDLIHHLVGLDYDLWRTCVSLGQGEVANFVTDAQKKRTELLERAFRLQACPPAQALARKRRKEVENKLIPIRASLGGIESKLELLESINHTVQSETWEADRKRGIEEQESIVATAKAQIKVCDEALIHEAAWRERAARLEAAIETERAKLQKSDKRPQMGRLHAEIGGTLAEIGIAERDLGLLRKALDDSQRSGTCEVCGQALPAEAREQHLSELEDKIRARQAEISTLQVRAANLKAELGQLAGAHTEPEAQLAASGLPAQLREAEKAIVTIDRIKMNRETHERTVAEASSVADRWRASVNPWDAEREKKRDAIAKLQSERSTLKKEAATFDRQSAVFRFWEDGFGPNGLPVLVLRTALHELETYANAFLSKIGRVSVELEMLGDELEVKCREFEDGELKLRDYLQLSGGQRRCMQLAFTPFALSEMVFARTGVRVPFLVIDELVTHLDPDTKPLVCQALRELDRETILVIDQDLAVQGEFDEVYDVSRGGQIRRSEDG